MTDDLGKIAEAMEIARATLANMWQNLGIAVLTVVGLLLGVYIGTIHMAGGMLVHQLSVLIVILNAMRLLRVPKAAKTEAAMQIAERASAYPRSGLSDAARHGGGTEPARHPPTARREMACVQCQEPDRQD